MYKAIWRPREVDAPRPCWLLNTSVTNGPPWDQVACIVLDAPGQLELKLQVVKLSEVRILRRVTGILEGE
jgi:hypothetical protein